MTPGHALWDWRDLCSALSLNPEHGPDIEGISIDSRSIASGQLFVALSGKPRPEFNVFQDSGRDGHAFIASAIEHGAAAVLVDRAVECDSPTLQCPDTLIGLWDLARFRRDQMSGTVVAVTGSSGKTTFKSFLSQALGCAASEGSLNNHIGVPLSIARMAADTQQAVLEIGTNHPGEIAPLSELARPHIAVVLNVLNAHIGNFNGLGALVDEKLSIGEGVEDGGVLVVHENLIDRARARFSNLLVLSYGGSRSSDYWFEFDSPDVAKVSTSLGKVQIPGGGEHRAASLCAVAAVLDILGEPATSLNQIADELPPGRGRRFQVSGITLIDESYNANPESMLKCLEHLAEQRTGRRIAIVGAMAELGDETARLHASLINSLNSLDGVISVGSAMNAHAYAALRPEIQFGEFESVEGLIPRCVKVLEPGDVVLVKGSNTVFWTQKFVAKLIEALSD